MAASDFQVTGKNDKALFTLKVHRGDGMCLVAMDWKEGDRPTISSALRSKASLPRNPAEHILSAEQPRGISGEGRRGQ